MHAQREVQGHIEFDEAAFPDHEPAAIEARIIRDAATIVAAANLCPYCRGRGEFDATLRHGESVTHMIGLCGQCMGTGERDAADAVAMIDRVLAAIREALVVDEWEGSDATSAALERELREAVG